MHRVNVVAIAAVVTLGFLIGFANPGVRAVRHSVRRRAVDRRRRTGDRERDTGRGGREDRPGRQRRRRSRARRRHAREPRRQDRDADDHRHARPSQPDSRRAHTGLETARLLRRQRRAESWHWTALNFSACAARRSPAPRGFSAPGEGSPMPEPGRTDVPYWINERGGSPQGG